MTQCITLLLHTLLRWMRRQLQRRPHVLRPGTDRRAHVRVAVGGTCVSFLVRCYMRAGAGACVLCVVVVVVVVVCAQRRQGRARGSLGWLRRHHRTLDLASVCVCVCVCVCVYI